MVPEGILIDLDLSSATGVTSIGERAFSGCKSLTSVIFEDRDSTWIISSRDNLTVVHDVTVADPATNTINLRRKYVQGIWRQQQR